MMLTTLALALALATSPNPSPAVAPVAPEAPTPVTPVAATPAPARVVSDADAAYFAARWIKDEFTFGGAGCPSRRHRGAAKDRQEAFVAANPAYTAALATPPAADVLAVVEGKLEDFRFVYADMAAMMAGAPAHLRDAVCDESAAGAPLDFATRVESARKILADAVPPPAEEPLTGLDTAHVGPIVAAVLQHPDVAMYLHPDVPGRVPVRVAVAAPYDGADIALSLYGAPIQRASPEDRDAVQLVMKPQGERVEVKVEYHPEGIFGTVVVERRDGTWQAVDAKIFE